MTITVGIDVAKAKFDVAVLELDGEKETYHVNQFENNKGGYHKASRWLKKRGAKRSKNEGERTNVCIEATGRYGDALAEAFLKKGYRVSVVNPVRVKSYGESRLKRNKTDREDAKVIAHFCATQSPAEWEPPSEEMKELQALTRYRETLIEEQTRIKNRLQSNNPSKTVEKGLKKQLKFIKNQLEQIEKEIRDHIDAHPELAEKIALLVSIPGIGETTAAILLSEMPDIDRFDNVRQLVAFAGLSPYHHQSGSSVDRPGRLVKTGQVRLRRCLFMPAMCAMRYNPIIISLVERLAKRGKCKMKIVGAVMKKLLHLVYGILKTGRPFDPDHLKPDQTHTSTPLTPSPTA